MAQFTFHMTTPPTPHPNVQLNYHLNRQLSVPVLLDLTHMKNWVTCHMN
jgi:hypothetical protein